jgi:nitrite reductase (NADH) large subunit
MMMDKPSLVVIGNGMAGMRTVEELLKLAPDMYASPCSAPSRTGTTTASCCRRCWRARRHRRHHAAHARMVRQHGITLHAGDPVVRIDRKRRIVRARPAWKCATTAC